MNLTKLLTGLFLIGSSIYPAQAQSPATGFCIENGSEESALFVVDAGDNFRAISELAPGERLCTPEFAAPANGFVSIFLYEGAIEGCSRLISAGEVQVLLAYHDFDRCLWQENR